MRDHPLLERELLAEAIGTRYQIVRLIGRGGAGSVFLCRDTALHRSVAIKLLQPEYASDPAHRELFRREARLGAQLGDYGTVPVLDIIERDEVFAFVMPYGGISLAELVERRGPLDAAVVQRMLLQLTAILARLHKRGLHHRDIKPDNVLVEGEGEEMRLRLTDFGIAVTPLADRGFASPLFVSGTLQYMSPEQALHRTDIDQRSDVYALGALAYFLLSGARPFAGETMTEVVALQKKERYRPLRELCKDVPAALEQIVRRCLRADPARRWATALALREALLIEQQQRFIARLVARWRTRVRSWRSAMHESAASRRMARQFRYL